MAYSFRYVECQFNALRRVKNRNQLDECLCTLPRDLDETYERILCSISDEYVEDVKRVLTVLCFSTRPLTVTELIDAHAVDLREPPRLDREGRSYEQDDLVDICLGLIEIAAAEDDNGQSILAARIAHFSVQEYLQSDRILQQKAARFALQSARANRKIAQICLVYLLEPELSVGELDETKLEEFPLASFAARHWFHHFAASAEEKPRIEQLVLKLFDDDAGPFVTWIRLHDMDRTWMANARYDRSIADIASPLYYAAFLGLGHVLDRILAVETSGEGSLGIVNAQGGRLGNPLQAASLKGHERVVQMLLDRGADVNAQGGQYGNALQAAAAEGHEKLVQVLLDRGADHNAKGGEYGTALHVALIMGNENVVQMLLDRGADVLPQGEECHTSLQVAFIGGDMEIAQVYNKGADTHSYALQVAAIQGDEKIVQMLLDRGADVNAHSTEFGSPLQLASIWAHEKVVKLLLDRGADVNIQGGRYGNALQAAAWRGHEKVVQFLLDRGANVNAQGGEYGNALQAALSKGHEKVVQILLNWGACDDCEVS